VGGIDVNFWLTTPNTQEAKVTRIMVEISRHRIVVSDASKFGRRSLCLIVPTSAAQQVNTDDRVSNQDSGLLARAGVETIIA
jgi:DeoR family transcriptional regulator of aga operon